MRLESTISVDETTCPAATNFVCSQVQVERLHCELHKKRKLEKHKKALLRKHIQKLKDAAQPI